MQQTKPSQEPCCRHPTSLTCVTAVTNICCPGHTCAVSGITMYHRICYDHRRPPFVWNGGNFLATQPLGSRLHPQSIERSLEVRLRHSIQSHTLPFITLHMHLRHPLQHPVFTSNRTHTSPSHISFCNHHLQLSVTSHQPAHHFLPFNSHPLPCDITLRSLQGLCWWLPACCPPPKPAAAAVQPGSPAQVNHQ